MAVIGAMVHTLRRIRRRSRSYGKGRDRVCYLHLGMNKTGSTSIQACFHRYDDGWLSYLPLGEANHGRMMGLRYLDPPAPYQFFSAGATAQAAEKAQVSHKVDATLAAAHGSVIISGEALSAFNDRAACDRVLAHLGSLFDRVEGVMYVREPVGYIASSFQQQLKRQAPGNGFGLVYPNYRRRLEVWVDAFADAGQTLSLVPFDRSAFADGDLLTDFARRTGISERWLAQNRIDGGNASLSAEAVAALLRLRQMSGPSPVHGTGRKANIALVRALRDLGQQPFALDPAAIAPVLARDAEDIAWMEARLGQPFPPPRPAKADRLFTSIEDIADFGSEIGPMVADWQRAQFPGMAPAFGQPEDILAAVMVHLLNTMQPAGT